MPGRGSVDVTSGDVTSNADIILPVGTPDGGHHDADASPNKLTIEQLAAKSGMSVRNIRAHQARGLLAPPEVRLRVGYYGPEHVAQLRLIRDLQNEGFNLGGIKRLLADSEGTAQRLVQFRQALTERHREPVETLTRAELAQRFRVGGREGARELARAERLGLLHPVGGDAYEAESPSLLAVAEEVVAQGISLDAALGVFEEIERNCDEVARAFVNVFVNEVWRPFQRAGMPPDRWPQIDRAIERLRPLSSQAVLAIFGRRMSAQIDAAFGDTAERLDEQRRTSTGSSRTRASGR
jgi:DNA-binding transcriptional MerR regulator